MRVPWTTRRSKQSVLKGIILEYSLEVLMLKLKLQYFGHLMQRTDSLEKTLMLGKTEGERRRGRQRMRRLDGITTLMDMSLSKLPELVMDRVLLSGKCHGWRSLVGCSPWGRWGSDTTEQLHFHFSLSCIGEGNSNPLQCLCLENPGTGEPGGLLSMELHRVGHNWSDLAAAAAGRPGVLQSMGLQSVWHNWVTELN